MKTHRILVAVTLLALSLAVTSLYAQAPQLINYQGKLNQAGAPANGSFSITFSIYAMETGGSPLWTEDQTVSVTNGVFNVLLGSVTPFPNNLFLLSGDRFLGIKVGTDSEMTPRFRFASVAYALRAAKADTALISLSGDGDGDGHSLDAADGDPTDVVFVDSTGNVGIGTNSPGELLHLFRADNPGLRFEDVDYATEMVNFTTLGFRIRTSPGSGQDIRLAPDNNLLIPVGNVGIGTTDPQKLVHLFQMGQRDVVLGIERGNNSTFASIDFKPSGTISESNVVWGTGFRPNSNDYKIWTADGSSNVERFVIKNNGMVGIGTTDPGAKLHIGGTAGVDGIMFPDGTMQTTAASGGAGDGHSLDAADGDPTDVVFVDNNGNVGIGTTTPGVKLAIVDSAGLAMHLRRDALNEWFFAVPSGSDKLGLRAGNNSSEQERVTFLINGNVGIGTTSPDAKLHIGGNAGVDGIMFPDGSVQTTAANGAGVVGNTLDQAYDQGGAGLGRSITADAGAVNIDGPDGLTVNGNVGIGTTSPAAKLDVAGNARIQGLVLEHQGADLVIGTNDGRDIGSRTEQRALVHKDSDVLIVNFDGDFEGGTIIEGFGAAPNLFVSAESDGNVGIGLPSPSSRLEVKASFANSQGGIVLAASNSDNPVVILQDAFGGDNGLISLLSGGVGRVRISTNDDSYFNGGNVGIGTTSPSSSLGAVSPILDITGAQGTLVLRDNVGSQQGEWNLTSQGADLRIAEGDTTRFTLFNGGNVGIGTTTPETKLHILDTSGGAFQMIKLETDVNTSSLGVNANSELQVIPPSGGTIFRDSGDTETNVVIGSDGNVGIGTENPIGIAAGRAVVHLAGSLTPAYVLEKTGAPARKWAVSLAGGSGSFLVQDQTAGASRFAIDTDGEVGIGTTSPLHPLHMASGAHVTAGGVWTDASSRQYKENVADLSVEEAVSALRELRPVKYNYKVEKDEEYLGFIAEDVPDVVATGDRKSLSPMDIVAVLTKVAKEQQKTIAALQKRVQDLEGRME